MFSEAELDRLINSMHANAVTSLEVGFDGMSLHLDFPHTVILAAKPLTSSPQSRCKSIVKSPCIGRFLSRGEDDGLIPLTTSSTIQTGEILGYIIHGIARACVSSTVDGKLAGDLPQKGQVFGYGDAIFSLDVTS